MERKTPWQRGSGRGSQRVSMEEAMGGAAAGGMRREEKELGTPIDCGVGQGAGSGVRGRERRLRRLMGGERSAAGSRAPENGGLAVGNYYRRREADDRDWWRFRGPS